MLSESKQKEIVKFLEEIVALSKESSKFTKSIAGNFINERAMAILSNINIQTDIPVEGYRVMELQGSYVVDRKNPEDEKWEGVKEATVFKGFGMEMLQKMAYDRKRISPEGSTMEEFSYKIRVLKKE